MESTIIIEANSAMFLCSRKFVNGEEKFIIIGVTSGSVECGGGTPEFYTYLEQEEVCGVLQK